MRVRFWGTRGSVPSPLCNNDITNKIRTALMLARGHTLRTESDIDRFIAEELPFEVASTFGGNTSCVEVSAHCGRLICDMGSGLRELGNHTMASWDGTTPLEFDFLMSHTHWDHIMGFPFFPPAYIPGSIIRVHGCHSHIEAMLRKQHSAPCFPVDFNELGASIEFCVLNEGEPTNIAGFRVTPKKQIHHCDSYGYKIEFDGTTVVYSTDSEHKEGSTRELEAFAAFFHRADLVIFDAMYSLADAITIREDWGHSSNIVGIDLCLMAKAKRLCLFHHEPRNDDKTLQKIVDQSIRYAGLANTSERLEVISAYDGLVMDL